MGQSFKNNVFVNCPFDDAYKSLLGSIVFTIRVLGLSPRLALESSDSADVRLEKIIRLIQSSCYTIRDLSRCQAANVGEIARFNMPFELGIDFGCKRFKGRKWRQKKSLILEAERYRYQAAISDLAGVDIYAHANDPKTVMTSVRDWLTQEAPVPEHSPTFL